MFVSPGLDKQTLTVHNACLSYATEKSGHHWPFFWPCRLAIQLRFLHVDLVLYNGDHHVLNGAGADTYACDFKSQPTYDNPREGPLWQVRSTGGLLIAFRCRIFLGRLPCKCEPCLISEFWWDQAIQPLSLHWLWFCVSKNESPGRVLKAELISPRYSSLPSFHFLSYSKAVKE